MAQLTIAGHAGAPEISRLACRSYRLFETIGQFRNLHTLKIRHLEGGIRRQSTSCGHDDNMQFDADATHALAACRRLQRLSVYGNHPHGILRHLGASFTMHYLNAIISGDCWRIYAVSHSFAH